MQATNLRNQGGSIPSAVTLPRPLPGTGDAYSTANRPYANKRQLVSRKVIPQATYDKIADRVLPPQQSPRLGQAPVSWRAAAPRCCWFGFLWPIPIPLRALRAQVGLGGDLSSALACPLAQITLGLNL